MTARHYGRRPKTHDPRDYAARPVAGYTGRYVDLSDGFPEAPYDQLRLGACVSNAVAAAVDYARVKQGMAPFDRPSRLFIYWTGRKVGGWPADEDSGLQVRDGFHAVAKYGAAPESDWAYDVDQFATRPPEPVWIAAREDEAVVYGAVQLGDIDAVISSGYPVVFGFDVHASFEDQAVAETGVMPVPRAGEELLGGHCVVAVSTPLDGSDVLVGGVPGIKYRLCRNSWGHDGSWGIPGRPGYFWMPATVMETRNADCWQVTTMSSPYRPVPPDPAPVPPADPFDQVIATLRRVWAALDAWLHKHGID